MGPRSQRFTHFNEVADRLADLPRTPWSPKNIRLPKGGSNIRNQRADKMISQKYVVTYFFHEVFPVIGKTPWFHRKALHPMK